MPLPSKHRLVVKPQLIGLLRKRGKYINTANLNMLYVLGETEFSRVSVIVGVSVSKKASDRNRLKRLCYESIRIYLPEAKPVDMILYPKKQLLGLDIDQVKKSVKEIFQKISYD